MTGIIITLPHVRIPHFVPPTDSDDVLPQPLLPSQFVMSLHKLLHSRRSSSSSSGRGVPRRRASSMFLPFSAGSPGVLQPPTPPSPGPLGVTTTVLVVDDASTNRHVLRRLVAKLLVDAHIEEASDGQEAVDAVKVRLDADVLRGNGALVGPASGASSPMSALRRERLLLSHQMKEQASPPSLAHAASPSRRGSNSPDSFSISAALRLPVARVRSISSAATPMGRSRSLFSGLGSTRDTDAPSAVLAAASAVAATAATSASISASATPSTAGAVAAAPPPRPPVPGFSRGNSAKLTLAATPSSPEPPQLSPRKLQRAGMGPPPPPPLVPTRLGASAGGASSGAAAGGGSALHDELSPLPVPSELRGRTLSRSSQPFDIVFCDLEMPVMGGLEAAQHIRKLADACQGGPRLVLIALTGHAVSAVKTQCMEAGFDDLLTKPVRRKELAETLKKYCVPLKLHQSLRPKDHARHRNPSAGTSDDDRQ